MDKSTIAVLEGIKLTMIINIIIIALTATILILRQINNIEIYVIGHAITLTLCFIIFISTNSILNKSRIYRNIKKKNNFYHRLFLK